MNQEKRLEHIESELESLEAGMRDTVLIEGLGYKDLQQVYDQYIKTERELVQLETDKKLSEMKLASERMKLEEEAKKIKESNNVWRKVWNVTKDCVDIGVKVAGVILVPLYVVNMAYERDKEMTLVNGRIFGLLGKKFDK